MGRDVDAVKNAILASGLDDWVHIAEVVAAARQARSVPLSKQDHRGDSTAIADELSQLRSERLVESEREALPLGIVAVKELLGEGLIRIGEISNSGFMPWRGSFEEIESRIDDTVTAAQYPLLPGHLFWIENTPSGDEAARSG
jgi:hypothetical protein